MPKFHNRAADLYCTHPKRNRTCICIRLAALIGTLAAIFLMNFCSFARVCNTLRSQTLRLHIIANSDSAADQQLKLLVRDAVVRDCSRLFCNCTSLEQTQQIAAENLSRLQHTAQNTLQQAGCSYPVEICLTNMWFDIRSYESYTLPAGQYRTLQIKIGKAEGYNWWCVLFPSLCLPSSGRDTRQEATRVWGEDGVQLITGEPKYKFAIAELWEKLRDKG